MSVATPFIAKLHLVVPYDPDVQLFPPVHGVDPRIIHAYATTPGGDPYEHPPTTWEFEDAGTPAAQRNANQAYLLRTDYGIQVVFYRTGEQPEGAEPFLAQPPGFDMRLQPAEGDAGPFDGEFNLYQGLVEGSACFLGWRTSSDWPAVEYVLRLVGPGATFLRNSMRSGAGYTRLDLSRVDISGEDFSGFVLQQARFESTNAASTSFRQSDLTGALFAAGADLSDADFYEAKLAGATFENLVMPRACLIRANPAGATFASVDATGALLGDPGKYTDLSDSTLTSCVFGAVPLDGTTWRRASLASVDLHGSHGNGIVFDDAQLTDVKLTGSTLAATTFRGATLRRVAFDGSALGGIDFTGATLIDCTFGTCDLALASFAGATLTGVDFRGANIDRVDFSRVDLTHCTFDDVPGVRHSSIPSWSSVQGAYTRLAGATLGWSLIARNAAGIDLRGAHVAGWPTRGTVLAGWHAPNSLFCDSLENMCHFEGVVFHSPDSAEVANFAGSTLDFADFSEADLTDASFDDAWLVGAVFASAALVRARFTGTHCARAGQLSASFDHAYLLDAQFISADLTNCAFAFARLEGHDARLSGCQLAGAAFDGASLDCLDLTSATDTGTLTGVSFSGARLIGASLRALTLDGVHFVGAFLQGTDFTGATIRNVDCTGAVMSVRPGQYVDNQFSESLTVRYGPTTLDASRFASAQLPDGHDGPVPADPDRMLERLVGPRCFAAVELAPTLTALFAGSDGLPDFTRAVDTSSPLPGEAPLVAKVMSVFTTNGVTLGRAMVWQLSSGSNGSYASWQVVESAGASYLVDTREDGAVEVRRSGEKTPYPATPRCLPGSTDPSCQFPPFPSTVVARFRSSLASMEYR